VVIWYTFPRFGTFYQEKSGNPEQNSHKSDRGKNAEGSKFNGERKKFPPPFFFFGAGNFLLLIRISRQRTTLTKIYTASRAAECNWAGLPDFFGTTYKNDG
jgi:hypothetical protein